MWYKNSQRQLSAVHVSASQPAAPREYHLYHGTKHPDPILRLEPRGGAVGVHAGSEEQARYMSGDRGTIYPVTFHLKNPLEVQDMNNDWEDFDSYLNHLEYRGHISREQLTQLSNAHHDAMYAWDEQNPQASHADYLNHNAERVRSLLQSHGYDGLTYKNDWEGEGPSYVAFRPDQITNYGAQSQEQPSQPS